MEKVQLRIPVFGDIHLNQYRQFDNSGSRFEDCLRVLEYIFEFADLAGSPYVFCTGDIYDNHSTIRTEVVNGVVSCFDRMFKKYPKTVMLAITGNHDQASKSLIDKPASSALEHLETVFEGRFICIDNSCFELEECGITVFGIPYYEYSEHYKKVLEKISKSATKINGKKVLLIHQTPSGLGNPNIPVDTDVNDELYKPFDVVFCGHIHARQEITPKFWVVGSPLHRSLEDEGQKKGFLIFPTDDVNAISFVSTRGLYPEFKRVRLKEGEEVPEDERYFIVPEYESKEVEGSVDASIDEFGSNLKSSDLLRNFWKTVDGKDEDLLEVGLSLL